MSKRIEDEVILPSFGLNDKAPELKTGIRVPWGRLPKKFATSFEKGFVAWAKTYKLSLKQINDLVIQIGSAVRSSVKSAKTFQGCMFTSVAVWIPLHNCNGNEDFGYTIIGYNDLPKCLLGTLIRMGKHPLEYRVYLYTHNDDGEAIAAPLSRFVRNVVEAYCGEIDHRNGNGLNNTRYNLREGARHVDNGQNRRMYSNNTSGFIGVSYEKGHNLWNARVNFHNRRRAYNAYFKIKEQAAKARDAFVVAHSKIWGRLNFPQKNYQCPTIDGHYSYDR